MLWIPFPATRGDSQPDASASGDRSPVKNVPIAVADASATAMECALLANEAAEAARHLAGAMVADAWLCHWVQQGYWVQQALPGEPATIQSMADKLAANCAGLLASFPVDTKGPATTKSQGQPTDWQRPSAVEADGLTRAAVVARRSAERVMEGSSEGSTPATSPDYLQEMLQVANDLASDIAIATIPIEAACPAGLVSEYQSESAGIEWRLPRLADRLGRFDQLSEDFDAQLLQSKLDAMKELAYGASHEINNPLANISGRAQSLLRDETDPRRRRLLSAIDAQAMRAHEMISDLMLFARPPAIVKEPTLLAEPLQRVIEELKPRATASQITIDLQPPTGEVMAPVDPTQFAVAAKAVLQNAVEAVGNNGRVTATLSYLPSVGIPHSVCLRVADTGPGLTDEVQQHLFDPFYSGREAGRGLGFGLSKCWRIVTGHGGEVEVRNENKIARGGESSVTVLLRFPLGGAANGADPLPEEEA